MSSERQNEAATSQSEAAERHKLLTEILDEVLRLATEDAERPFSEYLTQIDQSRERAQATQVEIDQLRTETRQLIAQLLHA